jgi:hypothetical protein
MFSVKAVLQGKIDKCTACRPTLLFIGREPEKRRVWRAPPPGQIVHYRARDFVTPAVEANGNSHAAIINCLRPPTVSTLSEYVQKSLFFVNNQ